MSTDGFFTRDELFSGLPARRASTLLFLIESRTALLASKSRQAMQRFLTQEAVKERDLAYLDAFSAGRNPPIRPSIQDLERFAPQWSSLVPDNPQIRSAVAHNFGNKYKFTQKSVPGIRSALGLDTLAVGQIYLQTYKQPIGSIYAEQIGLLDQLRWSWTSLSLWLEELNPFWTAFSLTLTETVGAGILALPIVIASIGLLAGVILLILVGLVNVFTVAAMAESASRSANIRYGSAYLGRMVSDYLGSIGSFVLSVSMAVLLSIALFAYYFGFSTTLADITHLPAIGWAVFLFLIGLYFIRSKSFNATIASALAVGAINLVLILILSFLAFAHVNAANYRYKDILLLFGPSSNLSGIGLVFGVIMVAYFGHTSVGNCARVVLRRDPTGRSRIWGCITGQLAAIAIYSIWILGINGTIAPQQLINQAGTVLSPLAVILGPVVTVLGSLYVVLAIGMGSIHYSLGLSNLVRERLPHKSYWVYASPIFVVFFTSEWFLYTGNGSFTKPLGYAGVMVVSLLAGIFPVLLLVSSRQKGEIMPGMSLKGPVISVIAVGIYLIFLTSLMIHGLAIWRNTLQGDITLILGISILLMTILLIWRGAFSPRIVFQLHSTPGKTDRLYFSIAEAGIPNLASVQLRYPDDVQCFESQSGEIERISFLESVTFQIPANKARDLKVWAYQNGGENLRMGMPAQLELHLMDKKEQFDLDKSEGQVMTTHKGNAVEIVVNSIGAEGRGTNDSL